MDCYSITSSSQPAASKTSPVTPTVTTSRFESLPRELRNAIYEELWGATPVINARWKGMHQQLQYHNTPLDIKTDDSSALIEQERQERKLPLWLLASKTVLEESLEELVHGSIWTIGPCHKKRDTVVVNPMTGKSEFASWMNTSGTLPDVTKRDEMVLWMGGTHDTWKNYETLTLSQDEVVYLHKFIPRIGGVAQIRRLHLKTNISFSHRLTNNLRPED